MTALSPLDAFELALTSPGWRASTEDGLELPANFRRWRGRVTGADERLLARARGPVLDAGCGPGRHLAHLAQLGVAALGVDVSPAAAKLARRRGGHVVIGSIFGPIPDPGSWQTVLLLDGNAGIGGDPGRLLERVRGLLAPAGTILLECADAAPPGLSARIRLAGPAGHSAPFAWGFVDLEQLPELCASVGFAIADTWSDEGRWFAEVRIP